MRKESVRILRVLSGLLCVMLVFCMLVCAMPAFAQEATDNAEGADDGTVDVVKLVNDKTQGSRITKSDYEVVKVRNVNIPQNVISDPNLVLSTYARKDLYAGEYISRDQISNEKVPKVDNSLLLKPITESKQDYIVVTDYIAPNTGEDVSQHIQALIDANPKSTIYFPDGEYTIGYSLVTSGTAMESVSLRLSDGAVIKAHANWKGTALICLGGDGSRANDIVSVGSYYCVVGGTLDANSRANGINIDGGRETLVRGVCIKNAKTGILIKKGVNNSSSDCDFEDITIIGNGIVGEYGVKIEACDNTLTNIRIYNMQTGVHCGRGGNLINGVYVINNNEKMKAKGTIGIHVSADVWVSQCYVENCRTAFTVYSAGLIWDCTAAWNNDFCATQTAYNVATGTVPLGTCRADFDEVSGGRYIYSKGHAILDGAIVDNGVTVEGLGSAKTVPLS